MAVRLEELLCRCPRGADHAEPHMGCCKCVECPHCGWIQARRWADHSGVCKGLAPVVEEAPQVTVARDLHDSLDDAMQTLDDLGLEQVAEVERARFRAAVRDALEEVLEHHQWLSGPFFYSKREERWGHLLRIIFSKTLDDDGIVRELIELFESDKRTPELEVTIWEMLAARDELFPSYATP